MYLDPGSWGIAIQALLGALLAGPVLVGIYWKRIKARFTRHKTEVK